MCLHPYCPMGTGRSSWDEVVADPRIGIPLRHQKQIKYLLSSFGPIGIPAKLSIPEAAIARLLKWLPCLYTQLDYPSSAESIVHLCEITLKTRITFRKCLSGLSNTKS